MANGFVNRIEGLLSGANPLGNLGLGLLAASGPSAQPRSLGQVLALGTQFASDRQRQATENELLRQEVLARKRQSQAQQQLTGLLGEQTHVPMSAPIGLLNMEGGVDVLPATRRAPVPTVNTPQGQDRLMRLLAQLAPEELARSVFSRSAAVAPEFKTDVGKLFGDLDLAETQGNAQAVAAIRQAIEGRLQAEGVNFDDLRAARNDTIKNSEPFLVARQGFNRVVASANSATPAGDLALTFGLMKILDPTSVVREGEQATVRNAGSIPERIRGWYNRVLTGETLTPEQRADFLNQAQTQFAKVAEQQNVLIDDAREFAQRNNLPIQDVVPEFVIPNFAGVSADSGRSSGGLGQLSETVGAAIAGAGGLADRVAGQVSDFASNRGQQALATARTSLNDLTAQALSTGGRLSASAKEQAASALDRLQGAIPDEDIRRAKALVMQGSEDSLLAARGLIDRAVESAQSGAATAASTARQVKLRIADIGRMSLEKLQQLDPAQMTREQLEAAQRRWEELTGG